MEYFAAIALSQNKWAILDVEDFYLLGNKKWCYMSNGYTASRFKIAKNKYKLLYMHRVIMNFPNKEIDHINNDKLDNRKVNLRLASHQQNMVNWNQRKGSSKFRGVTWSKERKRWIAQICHNNVNRRIGRYKTEEEAAKAYDKKAKELFGEFAILNFKGET